MRLLIVTTVNDMMRDFLLPFARHYRALGCTVDGMARRDDTFEACATAFDRLWPIGWSRSPWDLWNLLDNVRTVRSVVARENYDLVHVHTPIAAFITRMALRKLRGKLRVIYTAHGFHFHTEAPVLPNTLFLAMEKLAGRWTDYLVVLNQEDMVAARRHRIVAADRVHYMPGIGVSTDQYSPQNVAEEAIAQVRLQLGLSPSDRLFLMIAEFTTNKRHGDAIRALAMLQRPDVHLALAGRGEQAKTARNLASDLGVARQVHFLGYRKDIPVLIRASVATVLVSAREGLPRSVMESLCLETPVIGTNIRGINDLVTGECGWLVGVGDVAAIARAMTEAVEKPEDTLARGLCGRSKMAAYDLRNIIGLHDDLYAKALGRINIAAGDPPMTSGNGLPRVQRPSSSPASSAFRP
ncbi:MAG: glycosyltransferase [Telluria sp.]|jgi:glycosyltransferase involved in cell wall biosynthesis